MQMRMAGFRGAKGASHQLNAALQMRRVGGAFVVVRQLSGGNRCPSNL